MARYLARRFISLIFVILGVSVLLFGITYVVPGDPAVAAAGPQASREQVDHIRKEMGLDKPAHIQYLTYMRNLLRGDLGISIIRRRPVTWALKQYLPATAELMVAAMLFTVLVGFPLGVLSAMRPGKVVDTLSRTLTAIGIGMPVFWVALMAQLVFYAKLDWLPIGGRLSMGVTPPAQVTGFYTIDALLAGNLPILKDALLHLILPAIVLALPETVIIARITRSSLLEALGQDYMRTARAKGLSERRAVWIHGFKNAVPVPLTMLGMQVGWTLSGSFLVESVFAWGGLGFYAFHGIFGHDFPVLMGITLLAAVVFVLSSLVVDILHHALDPRLTYYA